jgi:hypothetical protein
MARIENQHTYTLKNSKGGTVVDLSGADNYSGAHIILAPRVSQASANIALTL